MDKNNQYLEQYVCQLENGIGSFKQNEVLLIQNCNDYNRNDLIIALHEDKYIIDTYNNYLNMGLQRHYIKGKITAHGRNKLETI